MVVVVVLVVVEVEVVVRVGGKLPVTAPIAIHKSAAGLLNAVLAA